MHHPEAATDGRDKEPPKHPMRKVELKAVPLAPSVQERYLGLFFSEVVVVSVVLVEATSIST